jgi:hypothetical protein
MRPSLLNFQPLVAQRGVQGSCSTPFLHIGALQPSLLDQRAIQVSETRLVQQISTLNVNQSSLANLRISLNLKLS